MFGRKKRSTSRIETLIAAGTRIEGNLFVSGGVHLEGTVVGNVTAEHGAPAVLSIAEGQRRSQLRGHRDGGGRGDSGASGVLGGYHGVRCLNRTRAPFRAVL